MLKFVTRKVKAILSVLLLISGSLLFMHAVPAAPVFKDRNLAASMPVTVPDSPSVNAAFDSLYDKLNLDSFEMSRDAYSYALEGLEHLEEEGVVSNDSVLTVIDFSLPSYKKRLFVIDLNSGELLFNTYVSHGRNSGTDMAKNFSNKYNSFQSAPGFYITGKTYYGEHGYSLRLDGKEKGINDNALVRKIVMHPADYVSNYSIRAKGYLGRSLGCPAIPAAVHKPLINTIKDGSCLFIYSPDSNYITKSGLIGQPFAG
jgi:hypothetical protein